MGDIFYVETPQKSKPTTIYSKKKLKLVVCVKIILFRRHALVTALQLVLLL